AGAARKVTARKNSGDTRHLVVVHFHRAPVIDNKIRRSQHLLDWLRIETVGDKNHISTNREFRSRNRARRTAPLGIRFTQLHAHAADAGQGTTAALQRDWIGQKLKA